MKIMILRAAAALLLAQALSASMGSTTGESMPSMGPALLSGDVAVRVDSLEVLVGSWTGGIEQGGAVVLRLGIEVVHSPSAEVSATLSSPDQGTSGIPITEFRLRGDSVAFAVASLDGAFRGTLNHDRSEMAGTWTQGPTTIPMRLARTTGEALRSGRPQDPVPPFPYREEGVAYVNPVDGTRLGGTLTLPEANGPFPAVLILSGSGPQDRDGMLMGHRPFLVLSDHLTRSGIAVLRVDDRGVGESSGDAMLAAIPERVADARAGLAFLRDHAEVDPGRVGLIGYSEGGWVAQELASPTEQVAFVVMLAAPAVAPIELLMVQAEGMLLGAGEPLVEEQLLLTRRSFEVIRNEPDDDRAVAAVLRAQGAWLESLPAEASSSLRERAANPVYQAELERTLRIQTTPWFRGLLAHEPRPLEGVRVPVLALFGERDVQVPPSQSVPMMRHAWEGHPDASVHVLPELNHFFQHARTGMPSEYAQIEETFAPHALVMIGDWISDRFRTPAQLRAGP